MVALAGAAPTEARLLEDASHLERGLVRRADEDDVAAHHVADGAGQKRVVRAPQQERVDLRVAERREEPLGEYVHLIGTSLAPLDELNKPRARGTRQLYAGALCRHRTLVGTRRDGADGADHTDVVVAAGLDGGPDSRIDDPDQRHVVVEPQQVERGGGRGVAGDNDHLHVVAVDQQASDLVREVPDLVERSGTVRVTAGVGDIDDVLGGEEVDQGSGDGQPAEAAVEHPDRSIVHVIRTVAVSSDPLAVAERAITLATDGDRNGAVSELIRLAGDVDSLERARDVLVRRLDAKSDDYQATAGLTLLNAAIATVGPKAGVTWKPKKWRIPR
jgi:hypothetical protein